MPKAGEAILALFNKLGGNMNNVLGTRSNITFLGKGKNPEGFIDMDINSEAIGFMGKNKILQELESSVGYLTAGKLNDVQANKLLENMQKVDNVFNPPAGPANITDMATGTRNLDAEGLGSLRSKADEAEFFKDVDEAGGMEAFLDKNPIGGPTRKLDVGSQVAKRNKEGVMSFDDSNEIATPFQDAETTFRKLREQGQDELALKLEAAMMKGPLSNTGDLPAKRATAREFLTEALKSDDVAPSGFNSVVSAEDVKAITEGGGGIGGDPILLVQKYFGPRIFEALPVNASSEEIVIFTKRVFEDVVDAAGRKPNDPNFDRMTARFLDIDIPGGPEQPFAEGGRAGLRFGKLAGKAFGLAKKLENINKSVDQGTKMGYGALREYGIEAEDITRLFKEIAMDRTMVGPEKTQFFKMLNQVLKNPEDFPDGIIEIKKKLGMDFAGGGLAKILEV